MRRGALAVPRDERFRIRVNTNDGERPWFDRERGRIDFTVRGEG